MTETATQRPVKNAAGAAEPLAVQATDVTLAYHQRPALWGVDLEVLRGVLLAIVGIIRTSRVKSDAAMALILSVFFGAGLVVLTFIQRQPAAGKAGLDRYLFGQAAALLENDVITMAAVGAIAVLALLVLW